MCFRRHAFGKYRVMLWNSERASRRLSLCVCVLCLSDAALRYALWHRVKNGCVQFLCVVRLFDCSLVHECGQPTMTMDKLMTKRNTHGRDLICTVHDNHTNISSPSNSISLVHIVIVSHLVGHSIVLHTEITLPFIHSLRYYIIVSIWCDLMWILFRGSFHRRHIEQYIFRSFRLNSDAGMDIYR